MVSAKQLGLAAAILSLCEPSNAKSNITSDTYFYGQSEPVYPSRTSNYLYYKFVFTMSNSPQQMARGPVTGLKLIKRPQLWSPR
jgi:hypothetical protein